MEKKLNYKFVFSCSPIENISFGDIEGFKRRLSNIIGTNDSWNIKPSDYYNWGSENNNYIDFSKYNLK